MNGMKMQDSIPKLIEDIAAAKSSMDRIPEPSAVTDSAESVHDYDRVLGTNITVNYAMALDIIHRVRSKEMGGKALDICSGPGHLSICQKKYLGVSDVTGLDYSKPMVEVASGNAKHVSSGGAIRFIHGDALKLDTRKDLGRFDLVTWSNAAHQFDSIDQVSTVLQQAEKLCEKAGVVVVTDLMRLPTRELSERFVRFAGQDYLQQGMTAMYQDFLASMLAAWSKEELISAVPRATERQWFYISVAHLPFFQALVGVPKSQTDVFRRPSLDWESSGLFRSENAKSDWSATKGLLYANQPQSIAHPRRQKAA